ncbi:MAG: periplasmic nitrate reductase, NapE protein [Colwellia sp.]|nr:periplasmic nitrate reductase, NapE protein [Colwellia sp.]
MTKKISIEELSSEQQKKYERNSFIFLTVFLAPILSVAIVGALGFSIWFSQMFLGPPSI